MKRNLILPLVLAIASPTGAQQPGNAPALPAAISSLDAPETPETDFSTVISVTPTPQVPSEQEASEALSRLISSSGSRRTETLLKGLVKEVDELRSKEIVSEAAAVSLQKPKSSKRIGSKIHYSYKEGDVYEVRAGLDRVTDIELQPGEVLTNTPVAGDTVRWKIGVIKSGAAQKEVTHVVLKPLDTGIETNLLLATNKHIYHLRAVSGDWYMPSIAWDYPLEEDEELAKEMVRERETEPVGVPPENLRFSYDIDGKDYDWKPLRVFDDGQKTYIQMPKSFRVSEAPALFVIEGGGSLLVNYRMKGDYYVVDRLIDQAELRVGTEKKIEIFEQSQRKNFFEKLFE